MEDETIDVIQNSGYIKSPPDERDFQFGLIAKEPSSDMPSWEIGYDCEIAYGKLRDDLQGSSLGCVSFGSTNDIEMTFLLAGIKKNFSQRWIYAQIHGSGGGASPRDAYKLMNKQGLVEDEVLPTNPSESLTEAQMREDSDITNEVREIAAKCKIDSYYSISPYDWDLVRQAIYENAGCGGGYVGVNGSMGHFIFILGWKMSGGYKALVYQDSYTPVKKLIINKNGKYYLGSPSGSEIRLFEVWTAMKSISSNDMKVSESLLTKLYRLIFHRKLDAGAYAHIGQELDDVLNTIGNSEEFKFWNGIIVFFKTLKVPFQKFGKLFGKKLTNKYMNKRQFGAWWNSAADAEKLSTTIKGFFSLGVITAIVAILKIVGVNIGVGNFNELLDSIGGVIIGIAGAISAFMSLYGLIRKIFFKTAGLGAYKK